MHLPSPSGEASLQADTQRAQADLYCASVNSMKPSIVAKRDPTSDKISFDEKAICVPLPSTFAKLSNPSGVLQTRPLWEGHCIAIEDLDCLETFIEFVRQNELRKSETYAEERARMPCWKAHMRSVDFKASGLLEEHLSVIINDTLDQVLANPPDVLYAPQGVFPVSTLLLTSTCYPRFSGFCENILWSREDLLQPLLQPLRGTINCLMQLYAKSRGHEYVLEFMDQSTFKERYPHADFDDTPPRDVACG